MTEQADTPTVPDWLTVGATVAVLTHRAGSTTRTVHRQTVKAVATQSFTTVDDKGIVTRWRLDRPDTLDGQAAFTRSLGTWSGSEYVAPLAHPAVIRVAAEQKARVTVNRARNAFDVWAKDPADDAANAALIRAVGAAQTAAVIATEETR